MKMRMNVKLQPPAKTAWRQFRNAGLLVAPDKRCADSKGFLVKNSPSFKRCTSAVSSLQGRATAREQQASGGLGQAACGQANAGTAAGSIGGRARRQGCAGLAAPRLLTRTWHQASCFHQANRRLPRTQRQLRLVIELTWASSAAAASKATRLRSSSFRRKPTTKAGFT